MAKDPTQTQDEELPEIEEGEVETEVDAESETDETEIEVVDQTEEETAEDEEVGTAEDETELDAEAETVETEAEEVTEEDVTEENEADLEIEEVETRESVYANLSSKELSELLDERGLPASGNKAAKIERLIQNDFEPEEEIDEPQDFLEFLAEENVPTPPGGAYSDISPTNDEKILWAVTPQGEYYLALDEAVRDWKPTTPIANMNTPVDPSEVQMSVQVRRKKASAQSQ